MDCRTPCPASVTTMADVRQLGVFPCGFGWPDTRVATALLDLGQAQNNSLRSLNTIVSASARIKGTDDLP